MRGAETNSLLVWDDDDIVGDMRVSSFPSSELYRLNFYQPDQPGLCLNALPAAELSVGQQVISAKVYVYGPEIKPGPLSLWKNQVTELFANFWLMTRFGALLIPGLFKFQNLKTYYWRQAKWLLIISLGIAGIGVPSYFFLKWTSPRPIPLWLNKVYFIQIAEKILENETRGSTAPLTPDPDNTRLIVDHALQQVYWDIYDDRIPETARVKAVLISAGRISPEQLVGKLNTFDLRYLKHSPETDLEGYQRAHDRAYELYLQSKSKPGGDGAAAKHLQEPALWAKKMRQAKDDLNVLKANMGVLNMLIQALEKTGDEKALEPLHRILAAIPAVKVSEPRYREYELLRKQIALTVQAIKSRRGRRSQAPVPAPTPLHIGRTPLIPSPLISAAL